MSTTPRQYRFRGPSIRDEAEPTSQHLATTSGRLRVQDQHLMYRIVPLQHPSFAKCILPKHGADVTINVFILLVCQCATQKTEASRQVFGQEGIENSTDASIRQLLSYDERTVQAIGGLDTCRFSVTKKRIGRQFDASTCDSLAWVAISSARHCEAVKRQCRPITSSALQPVDTFVVHGLNIKHPIQYSGICHVPIKLSNLDQHRCFLFN